MAYTPNNPYIPGDPYSYDLKWIVNAIMTNTEDIKSAINDYISRDNSIINSFESADDQLSSRIDALYDGMQAYINEWLEDHPEATTTVQDGTLTLAKFTAAALAKILQKSDNLFTAGRNAQYSTIQAAYTAAVAAGGGTILIMPGEYDEAITMIEDSDAYQINFIGLSRDATIWKSSDFGYLNACFTGSGNLIFENLTMIKGSSNTDNLGGYALHMDYPGTEGIMHVLNCHLISYENAAIGCGTRTNQKITIENCLLENYKTSNTNTALLYHTAPEGNQTGQAFSLIGNTIIDHTASGAVAIYNSAANTETFEPVIINNTVLSNIYTGAQGLNYYNAIVSTSLTHTNSSLNLVYDKCYGNNHDKLNASKLASPVVPVVSPNGTGAVVTDPLTKSGFWQTSGNAGADVPTPSHAFMGVTITQDLSGTYSFTFAFDLNNGTKYYRFRRGASDSGWQATSLT